jgi:hypothetical protein
MGGRDADKVPTLHFLDDYCPRQFAAQAILDRGYGKPTQSIDANIEDVGGAVRFYALVPRPAATTEEGLAGNPVATSASPGSPSQSLTPS